ncbi:TetR/AcrR family transcriptional regulator [uncultured Microbacterium sp.]|uniref:TetR/AcrR family transcriptional regulator n=1 Tax=uncultured Microbacterium sp. TaxID=191216 RepID=UPI002602A784|nr:TetR/AcrR family transcriptional regulator [uncultured Microbacterium sp.]
MSRNREPGLRERKKQQTRRRLEQAAVAIVAEDGLDALTIDAISERAEVSPRTFFNYFDSKEDAILGLGTEEATRRAVSDAVDEIPPGPVVDSILELLMRASDSAMLDHGLRERRRAILRDHPELLGRHFSHIGRMLDPLAKGVQSLMTRGGAASDSPASDSPAFDNGAEADEPTAPDPHAQILLMMCGAALRAATLELSPGHADLPADTSLALLHTRAAALVRESIERLS